MMQSTEASVECYLCLFHCSRTVQADRARDQRHHTNLFHPSDQPRGHARFPKSTPALCLRALCVDQGLSKNFSLLFTMPHFLRLRTQISVTRYPLPLIS